MIPVNELRTKGLAALAQALDDVGAERFIAPMQREPFDYTRWRQGHWEGLSIEEISSQAMALRQRRSPEAPAGNGSA